MNETALSNRSWWISIILMVAVGLIAYSNTGNVPFLLDDSWRIVANRSIRSLWPLTDVIQQSNRPVVNVTFAINYAIHGLNLWGYHACNLLIHLFGGLCLFGCIRRSLNFVGDALARRSNSLATVIALIWIVHPLQTSAVTYINQRYESLMGLMYLGTFYLFIRSIGAARPRVWLLSSIIVCGIGMACKEDMVSAPLLLLWYDRAFTTLSWKELFFKRKAYYAGLAGTWGILIWAMTHYTDEYINGGMVWVEGLDSWTYLLSQSAVIVHYLRLVVWPFGQSFVYDWPVAHHLREVLPYALIITFLLLATVSAIVRSPKMSFLGGWFFLILAPTSSFIPIMDLAFEHRMYLPLISAATLLVLGLDAYFYRSNLSGAASNWGFRIVSFLLIAGLTVACYRRNDDFRSEISIWQSTLDQGKNNSGAWQGMGCALVKAGKPQEARDCFLRATQLKPRHPKHQANYAISLYEIGEYDLAEKILLETIKIAPQDAMALRCLGNLMLDTGRMDAAIDYCRRSVELVPQDEESQTSLVAALISGGKLEQAIDQCEVILKARPKFAKAYMNMAVALMRLGRQDEAVLKFEAAIEAEPNNAFTHGSLGLFFADSKPTQAIAHLQKAYELDPNQFEFQFALAKVLMKIHPEEALTHFRAMIENRPDDVELRYKLVSTLVTCGKLDQAVIDMEFIAALRPDSSTAQDYLQKLRNAASQQAKPNRE